MDQYGRNPKAPNDQPMPAKSRSTAPRVSPVSEPEMDAMREHQIDEGIKRGKPTVGFAEEAHRKFHIMMGKMGLKND